MLLTGKKIPAILVVAAIAFIAIGIYSTLDRGSTVAGQVISVESASVTKISSLTIEDANGKHWVFVGAKTFSGFTPSHLEEHRALHESVTVKYEESETGELTIIGLAD